MQDGWVPCRPSHIPGSWQPVSRQKKLIQPDIRYPNSSPSRIQRRTRTSLRPRAQLGKSFNRLHILGLLPRHVRSPMKWLLGHALFETATSIAFPCSCRDEPQQPDRDPRNPLLLSHPLETPPSYRRPDRNPRYHSILRLRKSFQWRPSCDSRPTPWISQSLSSSP